MRLPLEVALGLGGINQDGRRVVRAARTHLDGLVELQTQGLDHGIEQLLDRVVAARGDVVVAALPHAANGLDDHLDQIGNVDEIAPGIHDKAGLALRQPLVECRRRPAQVARPVGVGQAEGQEIQPGQLEVLLAAGLADGITAAAGIVAGEQRVLERDRLLEGLEAVAQRRLEIDEPAHARSLGRLCNVHAAEDVGHRVFDPIIRILVRRRGVHHRLGLEGRKSALDQVPVGDRPFDHRQPFMRRQVVAAAGGIIVQDEDFVAPRQQRLGQMRPDESRSARDEYLHNLFSCRFVSPLFRPRRRFVRDVTPPTWAGASFWPAPQTRHLPSRPATKVFPI